MFYNVCVCACLYIFLWYFACLCLCTMCVSGIQEDQNRAFDLLGLEL